MGIVGEKTVSELIVGDTIAIQSQHEPRGYSVHTIERIEREDPYVVLFGSNLLEMVLYPDQTISLAGKTRNRWPYDHAPIARRVYLRYPGIPSADDTERIFAWARLESKRRMSCRASP